MKRSGCIFVFLFSSLLLVGCGPSQGTAQPDNGAATNAHAQAGAPHDHTASPGQPAVAAPTQPPIAVNATPQQVVATFLESLRAGDETVAAALLTDKAREETAKKDLSVQPPGTPAAKYQVGEAEYVTPNKDGAHVHSVWTESDEEGNSESYEIIWVLRQQQNGWRIAGMATQLAENTAPLFLNFEDPEEMLRKWQQASEEMARGQAESIRQARAPDDSSASPTLPR